MKPAILSPTKRCSRCQRELDRKLFQPRLDRKPGSLSSRCNPCRLEVANARNAARRALQYAPTC